MKRNIFPSLLLHFESQICWYQIIPRTLLHLPRRCEFISWKQSLITAVAVGLQKFVDLHCPGNQTYSSCVWEDIRSYWCSTTEDEWAECVNDKCPLESWGKLLKFEEKKVNYALCVLEERLPCSFFHSFLF